MDHRVSAASPDDQTIPTAAARTIIDRVAADFPAANARTLAQHALRVFGTVNARPPRWPAALGLGAVYVASLVAAVALTAAVAIGPREIAAMVHRALPPAWSLDAGAVRVTEGASFPAGDARTVVATFASPAAAREAFVAVQAQLPAGAGAALFGQSLLLSAAAGGAAPDGWSAAAAHGAVETLAGSPARPLDLTLTCAAPSDDAAQALAWSVQQFFFLPPALRLMPPWASPDPRSAEQRTRHERARTTLLRLESAGAEVYGDPRWREMMRQAGEARRADDHAGLETLRAESRRLVHDARLRGVAMLRARADADFDLDLADRYTALLRAAIAAGQGVDTGALVPLLGGLTPGATGQFAAAGDAWSAGRRVRVEAARFDDLFHGPAALAAWLRANGCAHPRYQFGTAPADEEAPAPS